MYGAGGCDNSCVGTPLPGRGRPYGAAPFPAHLLEISQSRSTDPTPAFFVQRYNNSTTVSNIEIVPKDCQQYFKCYLNFLNLEMNHLRLAHMIILPPRLPRGRSKVGRAWTSGQHSRQIISSH